jgi:hypothetical protein
MVKLVNGAKEQSLDKNPCGRCCGDGCEEVALEALPVIEGSHRELCCPTLLTATAHAGRASATVAEVPAKSNVPLSLPIRVTWSRAFFVLTLLDSSNLNP